MEERIGHTRIVHPVMLDSLEEVMRLDIKSNISRLCLYNSGIILIARANGARREPITREVREGQFRAGQFILVSVVGMKREGPGEAVWSLGQNM